MKYTLSEDRVGAVKKVQGARTADGGSQAERFRREICGICLRLILLLTRHDFCAYTSYQFSERIFCCCLWNDL